MMMSSHSRKPQKTKAPPPPPTEAEISLSLIQKLVTNAKTLAALGPSLLDQVNSLKVLYKEDAIIRLLLDPLDIAIDLSKGISLPLPKTATLEEVVASDDSLKSVWLGEVYADESEDQAISKLTNEFTKIIEVIKTKSFKSYLKEPDGP